jgi:hypothetical protein
MPGCQAFGSAYFLQARGITGDITSRLNPVFWYKQSGSGPTNSADVEPPQWVATQISKAGMEDSVFKGKFLQSLPSGAKMRQRWGAVKVNGVPLDKALEAEYAAAAGDRVHAG